jgi:hypothetical protein
MNDIGPGVAIPLIFGVAGVVMILLGPIGKALARRLEGRSGAGPDPRLQADVDELRARVAESEELRHRVSELEERLDFAERLLARQPESQRLARGDEHG